jgi:hypothetical protein
MFSKLFYQVKFRLDAFWYLTFKKKAAKSVNQSLSLKKK